MTGLVVAGIGKFESTTTSINDVPGDDLLEVYSPIRSRGTDEVIAVAEFYYGTDDLRREIGAAQRQSWLVVGAATILIYLLLSVFIRRASDTIADQQRILADQVARLTVLLRQNDELHERVRGAAARTTALNERFLRRISAELHDGPAQEMGLALLRLDHVHARCTGPDAEPGLRAATERDLELVEQSLRQALRDVRATSSGLLLPQLSEIPLGEAILRAARAHGRRTGTDVPLALADLPTEAPLATKIAAFRIVQEALANSWRHVGGAAADVRVAARRSGDRLRLEIADRGPGFDPATVDASEEHLGLVGMRERVVSLGGEFVVESAFGRGTWIVASLPLPRSPSDGNASAQRRLAAPGSRRIDVATPPPPRGASVGAKHG